MDNELSEIYAFMSGIAPFEQAPIELVAKLVSHFSIKYITQGQSLPLNANNAQAPCFYIVRKGALSYVKTSLQSTELIGKYGEGDICTVFGYPEKYADIAVTADEDCLLYCIEKQALLNCVIDTPDIGEFFERSAEERLKHQVSTLHKQATVDATLANTGIDQLYQSPAATIAVSCTIREAAEKMTALGFSCLVVVNDLQAVCGIVTDKDFRRRCIAQGIAPSEPISAIMTENITTMDVRSTAFNALITMTSQHIHHLPITDQGQLCGMLTITDLMYFAEQNAISLTSQIHKSSSVDELVALSQLIPKLQIRMAKLGIPAEQVGKSISAITMAVTIRLIEIAEQLYGAAPVPFAWVAAGSQARQEQLAQSDQDNGLIIDNSMRAEHAPWFEKLATFVCDGLAKCGFVYCPGEIMATNPKWRTTQAKWQQYFNQWITTPDPNALLQCSVFFDLATIYGDTQLLAGIQQQNISSTQGASLFIAHLSRNALQFKPPLGFFRDFVLVSNGDNKKTLDLKHNGIAPIVDLARIYALQQGITAVNTIERLRQAAGTPAITQASADNLIDAFEFLTTLRLNHQANRLNAGQKADNYLSPTELSKLEREHLKDAFKVIKTLQDNRQAVY
ncbi:cyclic nucleotide-binding/CBS domain-containing protein [Thalassotalea euphylliae]|uniref:Cyclic nucleotide-binding/CBS domain-containing protein n=1 Tax=Thalassotalea euphylliae TaxID=1655234 RepID=A0A3E0TKW7_9GAMM|nr:putative nucleotidyltransferase substrate binding domain-containing protein [Thalassotalea euphylliae]REL25158.1 cyclic nucleotide-binding/CBS domain-containing protein [Thalassotalea euphylliae]